LPASELPFPGGSRRGAQHSDYLLRTRPGGAVEQLLGAILACGPRAIRLQKALVREWEDLPLSQAIARGITRFGEAFQTDEPKRMMAGFLASNARRKK